MGVDDPISILCIGTYVSLLTPHEIRWSVSGPAVMTTVTLQNGAAESDAAPHGDG